MGLDVKYPDSAVLSFQPNPDLDRFWVIPAEPERRPFFLSLILELMGEWKSCRVWRHLGFWPFQADNERPNDIVEFVILNGIGLPLGTDSIVEFTQADINSLLTLLFTTTIFGWSVGEDLYIVPDHAQHIIQTDHHGVIHVSFRDTDALQLFVDAMEKEDFLLPQDVPDDTFRVPKWMNK